MEFKYSDGGRSKYFKATNVGDCVSRAIANATGLDYKKVYDDLQKLTKESKKLTKLGLNNKSVRNGTYRNVWRKYLEKDLGLKHISTMAIGKGCQVHLVDEELPQDKTLIIQLSKHLTCYKNGVLIDTYDCSKKQYYDEYGQLQTNDRRCVYGMWVVE